MVLTYDSECATVWYNAVNNVTGERSVRVQTKHDNGHAGVSDMSPRAVGLIAAMLLARRLRTRAIPFSMRWAAAWRDMPRRSPMAAWVCSSKK